MELAQKPPVEVPTAEVLLVSPPAPRILPAAWPAWQCIAFRYVLCHYVLYAAFRPVVVLLGMFTDTARLLGAPTDTAPWTWLGWCSMQIFQIETGWQWLTSWMYEAGFAPYEVIHQRTGSGDTAHDITKFLVIVAASAAVTAVWSLLARRPTSYPRSGRWLHLVVRIDLAFWLLSYGLGKFNGGQFGELELMRLTQEIGDTSPMGMVGTFMQASKAYELFGGGGEVLGGLLLFHHRTALLGAFVSIGVMANVCALNWMCGVPVKLFSAHLLLFAIGLLAPFWRRLWALFVTNEPSNPVDMRVVQTPWLRWLLVGLGTLWVGAYVVTSRVGSLEFQKQYAERMTKSPLYGLWVVDKMSLDGKEVPTSDGTRWRYFAIDRGKRAWARAANGEWRHFEFVWDAEKGSAATKDWSKGKDAPVETWTCELGKKTVPVDVPLLMKNEDRGRKVDGERRTLLVKGKLGEQQLELLGVEKVFRLMAGFRLRQELPEGW